MILTVVYLGDHSKLKALEAYDADFSAADYSGRTALHVAASTGQAGLDPTLIKKKTKFSSYIRKFRWEHNHIYEKGLPNR
jgi:hypothetical protein